MDSTPEGVVEMADTLTDDEGFEPGWDCPCCGTFVEGSNSHCPECGEGFREVEEEDD